MRHLFRLAFLLFITTLLPNLLSAQSNPPWVKTYVGYNYIFRAIDFPEDQNDIGFMAGESLTYSGDGIVIKTTDGGDTWTSIWTGVDSGIEGACFTDLQHGYVAGWPNPAINWTGFGKTTNGGNTWTSIYVVNDLYFFTDVVFKDDNNGIIIGSTNTAPGVWVTTNGGNAWTAASGIEGFPNDICYVSGNTYFLVDNMGNIKKSVNNGFSWSTVYSFPGLALAGVRFYDDNYGMVCGDMGVIASTHDGGTTWESQQLGPDIWGDCAWETADHVFICGTPEIVGESIDGGATWSNAFPQSLHDAAFYECIFTANGAGFICGSQGTLLKRVPSCTAAFTVGSAGVCTGAEAIFTDQSSGSNLTYEWTFEGGTPAVSTDPDPVVTYNSPGVYDVTMIVNNGYFSDTLIRQDYITVTDQPVAPAISVNGFELTSNISSGNQWYFEGNEIPGATGQNYTADQTGIYWDVIVKSGCNSDTSNHIYVVMTGMEASGAPRVTLSPVPNKGLFQARVTSPSETAGTLTVLNMLGVEVYNSVFNLVKGDNSLQVDISTCPAGIYFVVMEDEKGRVVRQMVKL
jgi:photosystem II stability/assembly factor-like uncharacterized protein